MVLTFATGAGPGVTNNQNTFKDDEDLFFVTGSGKIMSLVFYMVRKLFALCTQYAGGGFHHYVECVGTCGKPYGMLEYVWALLKMPFLKSEQK